MRLKLISFFLSQTLFVTILCWSLNFSYDLKLIIYFLHRGNDAITTIRGCRLSNGRNHFAFTKKHLARKHKSAPPFRVTGPRKRMIHVRGKPLFLEDNYNFHNVRNDQKAYVTHMEMCNISTDIQNLLARNINGTIIRKEIASVKVAKVCFRSWRVVVTRGSKGNDAVSLLGRAKRRICCSLEREREKCGTRRQRDT